MKKIMLALLATTLLSGCLLWEDYDDGYDDDDDWFVTQQHTYEASKPLEARPR